MSEQLMKNGGQTIYYQMSEWNGIPAFRPYNTGLWTFNVNRHRGGLHALNAGGFVGRGLGGPLLSDAIRRAWEQGTRRVWVHTCDLDHPRALANYQARGFRVFKLATKTEELPDAPEGPWPGANVDG